MVAKEAEQDWKNFAKIPCTPEAQVALYPPGPKAAQSKSSVAQR
jgi:hypothetical protein